MARSDLSERMRHHLDTSESVVARQEVATIRQEEMVDHHVRVVDRQEDQLGDLRTELRELGLRQEKVLREISDQLGTFMATQTELTREIAAESRAQRQALLAILDRLPPPEAD